MSENNSRRAHSLCLYVAACILGGTSIFVLSSAGLAVLSGPMYKDEASIEEFDTKIHKALITGGIFAGASLFVGVAGCIPLPSFISKRIASHSSDRSILIENGELENYQSVESNQMFTIGNDISNFVALSVNQDQPPDYQSIVENANPTVIENFPPPSYSSVLVANTTGGNENISPPSYATAAEVSSANTLPPSYEDSLRGNRDRRKSI